MLLRLFFVVVVDGSGSGKVEEPDVAVGEFFSV